MNGIDKLTSPLPATHHVLRQQDDQTRPSTDQEVSPYPGLIELVAP